jgi:hypothetical protein
VPRARDGTTLALVQRREGVRRFERGREIMTDKKQKPTKETKKGKKLSAKKEIVKAQTLMAMY